MATLELDEIKFHMELLDYEKFLNPLTIETIKTKCIPIVIDVEHLQYVKLDTFYKDYEEYKSSRLENYKEELKKSISMLLKSKSQLIYENVMKIWDSNMTAFDVLRLIRKVYRYNIDKVDIYQALTRMKEYDPETHICFSSVDGFYFVFKGYDIGIERMLDILAKVNMHDYGLDYLLSAIKPSLIKHGIDFSTIISEDIKNAIYDAGFKIEDLRAYEKQRIIFIERVYRIMKKKETNRFRNKILRFATLEARESRHTMSEFLYNLETLYMLFEQTRSTKRRKYLEENASLDETNELDKIYEWFYNLKYNLKAFEQHISNFVGVQLIPPYRSHEETVKLLLQLARNKEIKFASKESLLYHVLKHGDAAIDLFNKSAFLQNWAKKWRLYTTRANNAIAEHQMVQSHWEAIGGGRTFIFYLPNKRVTAMAVVFVSEYGEVFLKTYYTIAGTNKDRLGNMPSHHVEILLEKVEDSSLYLPVMQFISEVIDETVLLSEEQSSTSDYGSMSDISSLQDTTDFNDSELDIDDLMDTNRLEMKHSLGKHKNFAELIFSSDKPDSAIKISQYWLTYPLELEDFEDVRILTENAAVIFKEVLHKPSSKYVMVKEYKINDLNIYNTEKNLREFFMEKKGKEFVQFYGSKLEHNKKLFCLEPMSYTLNELIEFMIDLNGRENFGRKLMEENFGFIAKKLINAWTCLKDVPFEVLFNIEGIFVNWEGQLKISDFYFHKREFNATLSERWNKQLNYLITIFSKLIKVTNETQQIQEFMSICNKNGSYETLNNFWADLKQMNDFPFKIIEEYQNSYKYIWKEIRNLLQLIHKTNAYSIDNIMQTLFLLFFRLYINHYHDIPNDWNNVQKINYKNLEHLLASLSSLILEDSSSRHTSLEICQLRSGIHFFIDKSLFTKVIDYENLQTEENFKNELNLLDKSLVTWAKTLRKINHENIPNIVKNNPTEHWWWSRLPQNEKAEKTNMRLNDPTRNAEPRSRRKEKFREEPRRRYSWELPDEECTDEIQETPKEMQTLYTVVHKKLS